jgi:AcrR family transcriptional regulator
MQEAPDTKARRRAETENRREAILEAAWRFFLLQGIAGTSMMDIARSCRLAKGTLYLYFKSKDEIAFTLLVRVTRELLRTISACVESSKPAMEQIYDVGLAYYRYFVENNEAFRFMFIVPHESYDEKVDASLIHEWGETGIAALKVLDGILKRAVEEGDIVVGNTWECSIYLWSSLTGVLAIPSQEVRKPFLGNVDMERLFRIALGNMINGLKKRG